MRERGIRRERRLELMEELRDLEQRRARRNERQRGG
jgi:hypothetical protein